MVRICQIRQLGAAHTKYPQKTATMIPTDRLELGKSKALLKKKLLKLMPEQGDYQAPFGMVGLHRWHVPTKPSPIVYKPVVIVLAQGRKSVRFDGEDHIIQEGSYFIGGVEIPTICAMLETTPETPYLSMTIDIDCSLITQLAAEVSAPDPYDGYIRGAMLAEMDSDLMDTLLRVLELIERPEQATVLAPLVIKEIHYRLLIGPAGNHLRAINTYGTPGSMIAKATEWLKKNYNRALVVDELAKEMAMAPSTFHKHFKEITSFSPLQYQKRLRLAEAQRLMLALNYDAARACAAVGYESLPQFNREYKRLYGDPPRRDIAKIRQSMAATQLPRAIT